MVMTPSNMLPLGTLAPDFRLLDTVSGALLSLGELKSEIATVIMFICNHCPFVVHIKDAIADVIGDYQPRGISFVAISSNDIAHYPQDAPDKMKEFALTNHLTIPYLYDETQQVAKAYQAACTPDFYIFDSELRCVYRGQFDDSRPGNNIAVTGKAIRDGLDAMIAGESINPDQKSSIGCDIKWKQ